MFNIGEQHAKNIINSEGKDNIISIKGNSTVYRADDARRDLERLRQQLYRLNLRPEALAAAEGEMDDIDEGLASPHVNKRALAGRLERLARQLQNIGVLATAGQALAAPLANLAHWMGTQL